LINKLRGELLSAYLVTSILSVMSELISPDLPVAGVLHEAVMASRGAVIVTAPPGSGKTMLVPAAVLDDLPAAHQLILIQPRRLAARAVARRSALLRVR
jgi:HrpA-like RNA helicase